MGLVGVPFLAAKAAAGAIRTQLIDGLSEDPEEKASLQILLAPAQCVRREGILCRSGLVAKLRSKGYGRACSHVLQTEQALQRGVELQEASRHSSEKT